MIPSFIDKEKIPHKPGIYIYHDKNGEILYVGKAIDLYHRVSSYFNRPADSLKTNLLVANIASLETIIVESELEALVLEANLIKKYLPPYNISLKDDKDYLYIKITNEDFPRVITGRKKDLKGVKYYFGPFPSSKTVKDTLRKLRRIFTWCQLGYRVQGIGSSKMRPCFYYHLGLCPGPCAGKITKEEYNKIIKNLAKFLDGKSNELKEELYKEMEESSKTLHFEEAQLAKKTLSGLEYLTQPNRVENYLENPNFLEEENIKDTEELQKVLNLPKLPERIEGYDISNISGKDATGSMVVLINGEINKSQYRKFKIHISGKPNDYAMHSEMMRRRLGHLRDWGVPDLIIIDGGRGQVRAVKKVIDEFPPFGVAKRQGSASESYNQLITRTKQVLIFGLAKRMEWLYTPGEEIVKLPKRSLALRALQKLRDESHRFAISYHRKLRGKSFLRG